MFVGAGQHGQEIDGQKNDAGLRSAWLGDWRQARRAPQEISDGWAEEVAIPT
uniref:Uncharacterized protein n=1 Tax=Ralstonia syzygii R24 TaxID=907261 RepID=G3A0I5_9RALS|nr:hypothetical protein RALSY_10670 [Ralstonia syzygii R24]